MACRQNLLVIRLKDHSYISRMLDRQISSQIQKKAAPPCRFCPRSNLVRSEGFPPVNISNTDPILSTPSPSFLDRGSCSRRTSDISSWSTVSHSRFNTSNDATNSEQMPRNSYRQLLPTLTLSTHRWSPKNFLLSATGNIQPCADYPKSSDGMPPKVASA
ncbi:hypothetical protein C8Q75DRAFT_579121 [Abortiporus biennis]|nr:hypothetical protein C8Q75DRAFT_579121 [Abortiporus biennis]